MTAARLPRTGYPHLTRLVLTLFCSRQFCASPVISDISATPNVLWPPNYGLVPVTIGYTVDDACPGTCESTVSSNEPVKGPGDGKASADWRVVDAHQVELRARREGNGSGRVYTVSIRCINNTNGQSSRKRADMDRVK